MTHEMHTKADKAEKQSPLGRANCALSTPRPLAKFRALVLDGDLLADLTAYEGEWVEVKRLTKGRSNPQNRYYWGVVVPCVGDMVAEMFGERLHEEQIHDLLKSKFLPKKVICEENVPQSTRDLTTAEFEDYTARVRSWAYHYGNCAIPQPGE
jgi:hypothetical protein